MSTLNKKGTKINHTISFHFILFTLVTRTLRTSYPLIKNDKFPFQSGIFVLHVQFKLLKAHLCFWALEGNLCSCSLLQYNGFICTVGSIISLAGPFGVTGVLEANGETDPPGGIIKLPGGGGGGGGPPPGGGNGGGRGGPPPGTPGGGGGGGGILPGSGGGCGIAEGGGGGGGGGCGTPLGIPGTPSRFVGDS